MGLSTMSAAQFDIQPLDEPIEEMEAATAPFALKEQVAERLAAHRARRTRPSSSAVTPIASPAPAKTRSARIAAAVAERYAHSQSYRAFIAEESERAIRQAEAAAEVAALNARAVAEAQNQFLFELDQLAAEVPAPAPVLASSASPVSQASPQAGSAEASPGLTITEAPSSGFTVRLYDDVGRQTPQPFASSYPLQVNEPFDEAEGLALDDEIAFRQSPVFDEFAGASVEIPANLIEFPRQLVAARKARPRLAEGPLREDADLDQQSAQLRIFEVEATQISSAPAVESVAPEWSSILLGAQPAPAPVAEVPEAQFVPSPAPQTAPLNLRLMAAIVDGCIVLATFLTFTAVFAVTIGKLPGAPADAPMSPQTAGIASAGILAFLTLLYQVLFFTFSEATPGMRYARIGLCTFSDDNPTRAAMRRRIFAAFLSICPLGIGFLWAFLDDDGLGWHDRISRMYQRSY
ncbi:MAG TPA: RDD family protein [Edaphobacter sp.]|nr:RDD family protein [Edaphobacter sp.]